ncbi:hypothetical protein BJX66DRAFT_216540 [Aspergillus keveii]|uniref:Clr5 domain-containing protein n=1 Tax=Aspergillus keveii TaxID=714993 RepID=A0ABR4FGH8_9EURO
MGSARRPTAGRKHYFEFTRLYRVEELTLEQVREHFAHSSSGSQKTLTVHQWKRILDELRIFKNLAPYEKFKIKTGLAGRKQVWSRLFLVGDVLFENAEIENLCKRQEIPVQEPQSEARREVWFFDLPFDFITLQNPIEFKHFQRLLLYAKIHFEDSFDHGHWAPDHRGLYARSPMLQLELKKLSRQHNLIFDALKKFENDYESEALALIEGARATYEDIVLNTHHRQIHDVLAIMLMLRRAKKDELQRSMAHDLDNLAKARLPDADPRRQMFACLRELQPDAIEHCYVAFVLYCRKLWAQKVGQGYKASYSYSQASFPRVKQPEFYTLYEGKELEEIRNILTHVDASLHTYSSETFCLWLTALNYLWDEAKYEDLKKLAKVLCCRIGSMPQEYIGCGLSEHQLGLDATQAYYLLGRAAQETGDIYDAKISLVSAVEWRNLTVPLNTWDPIRVASLESLMVLALRSNDFISWAECEGLLKQTYRNV